MSFVDFTVLIAIEVEVIPNPNKFAAKFAHNRFNILLSLVLYTRFKSGLKRKLILLIILQSIAI
jgi:hypothetical protein